MKKMIILLVAIVLTVGYCDMFWKMQDIKYCEQSIEFNKKLDYYNYRIFYKFSKTMHCIWCDSYEYKGKYIILYDKYKNIIEKFKRIHIWSNGIEYVKNIAKLPKERPSGTIIFY